MSRLAYPFRDGSQRPHRTGFREAIGEVTNSKLPWTGNLYRFTVPPLAGPVFRYARGSVRAAA